MTQPSPEQHTTDHDLTIEAYRVDISDVLTRLYAAVGELVEFTDSKAPIIGFATDEDKAARDEQIIRERRDIATARQRLKDRNLHWNLLHTPPTPSAPSKAPGNVSAWQLAAETHIDLAHVVRRMIRALTDDYDITHRIPAEPTIGHLLRAARELSWHLASVPALTEASRDLHLVATRVQEYLERQSVQKFPGGAVCPHCRYPSLVIYHEQGLVRCQGAHECVCSDPLCSACKVRGTRHEWHNKPGGDKDHTSWAWLAKAIKYAKQINP